MYIPPYQVEPNKRTYYTTLNELSTTFNGFTAMKSKLVEDSHPPNYIGNERRAEIVNYYVDKRRAFNYSKDGKRYRPYDIAKDAYDLKVQSVYATMHTFTSIGLLNPLRTRAQSVLAPAAAELAFSSPSTT